MKLTIAIPTYNRNETLRRNLEKLLPQLTDDCKVLIFDNASDLVTEDAISDLLSNNYEKNIEVRRNKYNVGMTANILKCFEECDSPWLWVLGDDDEVKPDAVQTILLGMATYEDAHCITYAWDEDTLAREGEIEVTGIDSFLNTFETFGAVLFLSTTVYNVSKVCSAISFANFFQSSYAPHLVLLLMSLQDDGKSIFSDKQIVVNNAEETPHELRWDQIFIYQLMLLLRLPLRPKTIARLRERLSQLTRVWTVSHFIYTLTFKEYGPGLNDKPLILYGDVVRSFYIHDRRFSTRIFCWLGYFIIKNPKVFRRPMAMIYRLIRKTDFIPDSNLRI